jgi:predicted acetyltransferase
VSSLIATGPHLDVPSLAFMPAYVAALKEGFVLGEGPPMYGLEIESIEHNPLRHLDYLLGPKSLTVVLPDGTTAPRTTETLLWLVDGENFIGGVCLRHSLTKNLERWGGNIDFAIQPNFRGKGYGRSILRFARNFAKNNLEMEKLLVTCEEANLGARRVIEANDGEVTSRGEHPYKKGVKILRYWVAV